MGKSIQVVSRYWDPLWFSWGSSGNWSLEKSLQLCKSVVTFHPLRILGSFLLKHLPVPIWGLSCKSAYCTLASGTETLSSTPPAFAGVDFIYIKVYPGAQSILSLTVCAAFFFWWCFGVFVCLYLLVVCLVFVLVLFFFGFWWSVVFFFNLHLLNYENQQRFGKVLNLLKAQSKQFILRKKM